MAAFVARPSRTCRRIGLAALLVLSGSQTLQNANADGETRTLTLHHTHTGEDLTITFKRNGRYDDAALQKLNWFLRDWRRDESTKMDPRLFDIVWEVYRELGAKEPIHIISAYRSPQTNAMLRRRSHRVAQYSLHMVGRAMDFSIPEVSIEDLRVAGLRVQRGGVGFYPGSFVHLDTGGVRHWPRMTHDQLVRVFPDGKTVHIPSDGHPLPRYAVALADIERRGGSVSTSASTDDGPAPASRRTKRGIIERLFGFGQEDEDEEETTRPATTRPTVTAARPDSDTTKSAHVAAPVPLPPVRPARPNPPPGQFELASVTPPTSEAPRTRSLRTADAPTTAAPTPPPPPAPPSAAQPQAPGAVGANGQRFQWLVGPAGQPVERAPAPAAPEPPRPPANIPGHPSDEITASFTPWPPPSRTVEGALAYAPPTAEPPIARATPMGTPKIAPAAVQPPPPPIAAPRPAPAPVPPPKPGDRVDNPWLRSIVVASSVHYSMSVGALGAPDYRQLARLMHKPTSAVVMTFTADPNAGMTSERFGGAAVAFQPTVRFVTRTAGLR